MEMKLLALSLTISLIALVLLVSPVFANNKYFELNITNSAIYVQVFGKSMEPTIAENSILKCEKEQNYKIGDIVVFQNSDKLISHRIVSEVFGSFVTKGDGNLIPDFGLVSKENILCKVIL